MTIKILYFARLAETLGLKNETLTLPEGCNTIVQLIELLRARGEPFDGAFTGETRVLVAVNQEMTAADADISPGDEIAFFPPVTGG